MGVRVGKAGMDAHGQPLGRGNAGEQIGERRPVRRAEAGGELLLVLGRKGGEPLEQGLTGRRDVERMGPPVIAIWNERTSARARGCDEETQSTGRVPSAIAGGEIPGSASIPRIGSTSSTRPSFMATPLRADHPSRVQSPLYTPRPTRDYRSRYAGHHRQIVYA